MADITRLRSILHLALLTVEQSGSAEYTGGGRRWGKLEEADFEIGEIDDQSETLTDWRGLQGETPAFGAMPVEEEEYSPPGVVEDMDPDEQHFTSPRATKAPPSSAQIGAPRSWFGLGRRSFHDGGRRAPGFAALPRGCGKCDARGGQQGTAGPRCGLPRACKIASWPGNRRFLRQDQTTAAKSVHHRPASGVASRFTVRP